MTDVRLTATNPEDSSVVPVACNAKGELLLEDPLVIEGPPGPPGTDGDSFVPDPTGQPAGKVLQTDGADGLIYATPAPVIDLPSWSDGLSSPTGWISGSPEDAFNTQHKGAGVHAEPGAEICFVFPMLVDISLFEVWFRSDDRTVPGDRWNLMLDDELIEAIDLGSSNDTWNRVNRLSGRVIDAGRRVRWVYTDVFKDVTFRGLRIDGVELLDYSFIPQSLRLISTAAMKPSAMPAPAPGPVDDPLA